MENPFKSLYNSIENFVLRNATFRKVATIFYESGGGVSNKKIPYQRQGADMRTKEIKDWQNAVMYATDPNNPRRDALYFIYQSLLRDDDLQATIENRVLPLQMANYRIIDKDTGEENKEAAQLLERTWFQELRKMSVMSQLQGTLLVDLTYKINPKTMEIEEIEEIPQCNYIAQAGAIIENPWDTEGISYREGGLETYYYQFGKDWDLGLLNVLAIPIFAKKLGFGSWISYIDQFGIPYMFVVTNRMDEARRNELFEMMSEMRSARYAVLQGQEKVEYGNEASGNTSNAFAPFMDRCHNIITRLILGQTGTTNNEAYEGTSKVHEKVEKYRHEADKLLFMYVFNKEIIPRLIKISPKYKVFENCKLEWNNHETLSLKEYIDAIKNLAYTFDFDPEEVAKMTGLPITAVKEVTNQGIQSGGNRKDNGKGKGSTQDDGDDDDDDPDDDPKGPKKKDGSTGASLEDEIDMLYYDGEEPPEADFSFSLSDKIRERILNRLRSDEFNVKKDIDPDLYDHNFNKLNEGLENTFGEPKWGTPDRDFLEYARKNVAIFSGYKTMEQQKQLYGLLFDRNGNMKGFEQFRRDTKKILDKYNQNWLRTEYNTLVRRARFAADWRRFEKNKDLYPNLKWTPSTSIDKRDGHRLFYNRIWPIDDPFWDTNYPGNLWNCKCGIRNTDEGAKPAKQHNHNKPQPGLDKNPGKSGQMFTSNHPYIKNASKSDKKAVEKFTEAIIKKEIKSVKGVQEVIDEYLRRYPDDANGKKITVSTFNKKPTLTGFTMMQANSPKGIIQFNTYKAYDLNKNSPFSRLTNALNKIRKGEKLSFEEEYAIESFYHEILHVKAKGWEALLPHGKGDFKRTAMETVNQFVSRHEYSTFIERLGGKAEHTAAILDNGSGYKKWVGRFREVLKTAKIDEDKAYKHFSSKLIEGKYGELEQEVYKYFKDNASLEITEKEFFKYFEGDNDNWSKFIKTIKSNDQ